MIVFIQTLTLAYITPRKVFEEVSPNRLGP